MQKLVREYKKDGFNVKIYTPEATVNEKNAKKIEIKEKVINIVKKSLSKKDFIKHK